MLCILYTLHGLQDRDLWMEGGVEALSKAQMEQLLAGPRDKHTLVVLYAPWCRFCKVRGLLVRMCACERV